MFSLIITIIAIALVAALALATLYYGSDAFNKGSEVAVASSVLNTGQQIAGAYQLQQATKTSNSAGSDISLANLISDKYLQSIPSVNSVEWREISENKGWILLPSAINQAACKAFNIKVHNLDGIPKSPIVGVSKLCYGTDTNGYSVIWKAAGDASLVDTVNAVITGTGKDAKGDNFESSAHSPVVVADAEWTTTPSNTPSGEFAGIVDAGGPPPPPTNPPTTGFVYPSLSPLQKSIQDAVQEGRLPYASSVADDMQNSAPYNGYGIVVYRNQLPSDWEVAETGQGYQIIFPSDCPTDMSPASACTGKSEYSANLAPAEYSAGSDSWALKGHHNRAPSTSSQMAPGYVNVSFVKTSTKGTGNEEYVVVPLLISPIHAIAS